MSKIVLVIIIAIITVVIIRILKRSYSEIYFSFYQLILSSEEPFTFIGFLIIFLPLFIGSVLLSAILGAENLMYLLFYGFFSAFLIIWPVLLYSKELLPPEAYKKRKSVYFIYFLFIIAYITLSYGGYCIYCWFINSIAEKPSIISLIFIYYENLPSLVQGVIDNCIWIFIIYVCSLLHKKIKSGIKENT